MAQLPSGTVTFLFTDIEGSTRLLTGLRDRYAEVLADHQRVLRAAFDERGGREVHTEGDAFFVAFTRASDAISAAIAGQRALASQPWPEGVDMRVRMGVYTGEATVQQDDYVGLDVHRAARICAAGHGGQVLISGSTRELAAGKLPQGVALRDLGEHRLKDLDRPEHLFQVLARDLPADFPLAAVAAAHGDLNQTGRLRGAAAAHGYGQKQDAIEARLEAAFFATARIRHGADAWEAAVRAGGQLSFENAIAYALGEPAAQPER
jgi:class 3 adenylate cyclase